MTGAIADAGPGGDRPAPAPDCALCPRLAAFRATNAAALPAYFNAPVHSFGTAAARLLVVGLAPGLHGANQTGRPFTGDFAGDLLYATLAKYGFSDGTFAARPDDGLTLVDCRITNAVRCVPPQNKPVGAEVNACLDFLRGELGLPVPPRAIVALGAIAHGAVLSASGLRKSAAKFGHGAEHPLPAGTMLFDSYHCSRYNTNTRRLTPAMFEAVFARVRAHLDTLETL